MLRFFDSLQPHLTLARVRMNRGRGDTRLPPGLHDIMQEYRDMEFGHTDVNRIVLFRSQLGTDGPRYSELSATELSPGW
jgi:2'-5' RNA ligase